MSGTIKRRLFESSQLGSDPSNFYSADSRKQGKDRYHISIHFFTPLEQSIFSLGETRRAVSGRSKHCRAARFLEKFTRHLFLEFLEYVWAALKRIWTRVAVFCGGFIKEFYKAFYLKKILQRSHHHRKRPPWSKSSSGPLIHTPRIPKKGVW